MKRRWLFWILWVIINALASLFWAVFLGSSLPYFAGIPSGITCFIVLYTLLDGYLCKQQYIAAQRALGRGIHIKAGLQVLNLLVFTDIFAANVNFIPEVWAGSVAITLVDELLPHAAPDSFLAAFLTTLLTGALLSTLVGVISFFAVLTIKSRQQDKSVSP